MNCTSQPLIFACFEAFKAQLRPFHRPQLDALAATIEDSFSKGKEISRIRMVGHAAQWDDKGWEGLAYERARLIEHELKTRLIAKGLGGRVTLFAETAGSFQSFASNDTQEGRALNRRVEIIFGFKTIPPPPPPPPKKKAGCTPDEEWAKLLEDMPTAGLSQDRRVRAQINCLRNKLVAGLRCEIKLNDKYFIAELPGTAHFLTELRRRGKGKTGNALARTFNSIRGELLFALEFLGREISEQINILGTPLRSIPNLEECRPGRKLLIYAADDNHIYSCFKLEIVGTFQHCHFHP